MTGIPTAEGGDVHGNPRPGLGYAEEYRETETEIVGKDVVTGPKDPTLEDAYAEHVHDHRNGGYPGTPPAPPTQAQQDQLLAENHVDPGTAKKTSFVKLAEYEDASGKPLPSSPVERLRQNLAFLQGEAGGQSLKLRLRNTALDENDLGKWEAATQLKATTDQARTTLDTAVDRVYGVYAAVVDALAATVETAKAADRSAAGSVKKV
ncbi:hypothetical protein [Nonomuraea rubra]|uniref:hypothetical protein n=1 Tax=Nonomuraea rubra TaxID=46180 RepID=UPI00340063C2